MPFPQISAEGACAVVFAIQIFYMRIDMAVGLLQLYSISDCWSCAVTLFSGCVIYTLAQFTQISVAISLNSDWKTFLLWQAPRFSGAIFSWGHLGDCKLQCKCASNVSLVFSACFKFHGGTWDHWAFCFCNDEMACEYSNTILHIPYFVLAVPWRGQGFTCLFLAFWMTSYQM